MAHHSSSLINVNSDCPRSHTPFRDLQPDDGPGERSAQRRHAQVARGERFGGFGAGELRDQTVGVPRLSHLIRRHGCDDRLHYKKGRIAALAA